MRAPRQGRADALAFRPEPMDVSSPRAPLSIGRSAPDRIHEPESMTRLTRSDRFASSSGAITRGLAAALAATLVGCAAAPAPNAPLPDHPRVTIDAGALQGRVDSTGRVMVFAGLPVRRAAGRRPALAPAPPPLHRGSGVRDATRLGHNCMQHQPYGDIDPFAAGVSEDCLYLNVWTQSTSGQPAR